MARRVRRTAMRIAPAAVLLLSFLAVAAPSAFALPPANDTFLAAEILTGETATATGTNVEATKETGEPNHAGYQGGRSVWYRWTAPADGVVVVDTFTSGFDTLLAVYTGATVDGLQHVASNNDYNGAQSRVRITVTAGQEYKIAVDGYPYYSPSGSVVLHVAYVTPPANDNFAAAAALSGSSASTTGSNVHASKEPGEPSHGGYYGQSSVWWTWTAPSTGSVTLSTNGSSFSPMIGVYTGTSVSGLVTVASSSRYGTLEFRAVEGSTYRIALDSKYAGTEGHLSLALTLHPPPANDMFAAAIDLGSSTTAATSGTTLGAWTESGEPSHYSYYAARASVWYSWTAPSSGSLTLTSSTSPRTLAVYTGTEVSSLGRVPLQAQSCNCQPGQIRVRVEAGVTYRIVVDNSAYYSTASGAFNLSLSLVDRPPNDDFANAETLEGLSDTASGTNVGATQEAGEPIHEENYYDPSVWYSWTAPATGGVTLDLAGSSLSGVVAVYTGDAVSALTRVPSTAATGVTREKRYFRAAAGVTYRIAVDGQRAAMGTFTLALSYTAPPANDMLAAAEPIAGGDTTVSGNTLGATGENAEPNGGTAGATVWYQWTAAQSGRVNLSFPTRDFQASLWVYTGATTETLTAVSSSWTFRAEAGTTYRIQVSGGTRPWRGYFSLRLQFVPPPANDDFANAVELTGSDAAASGTNAGATRETGEPRHCCGSGAQSVWWRWTAPSDGRVTIDLGATWFDWVAGVYTGSSVGSLTRVVAADSGRMTFMATAGTTYRIAVDNYSSYGSGGPISFTLTRVDAPKNDFFADATVLQGSADDVTGTNVNASRESYEPAHAGTSSERSVWYRWRAPADGSVTIDTAGSGFDTKLGVYVGSYVDYAYLSTIASNDDFGGSPQARVTFDATRGTVYRIAVDGKSNATGAVALSLRHGTPPAHDAFASAMEVTATPETAAATNVFATKEPGEPDHADDDGGASVWFAWTAPSDGTLSLSTGGSSIDTVLGVYTGDAVDALDEVAATPANELTFAVTEGTEYRIAVDGANDRSGPVQGSVTLAFEYTADEEPTVEPLPTEPGGSGDGGDEGTGGETSTGTGTTTTDTPTGGDEETGGDTSTGTGTTTPDTPTGGDEGTGGDTSPDTQTGGETFPDTDTTSPDTPPGDVGTGGDTSTDTDTTTPDTQPADVGTGSDTSTKTDTTNPQTGDEGTGDEGTDAGDEGTGEDTGTGGGGDAGTGGGGGETTTLGGTSQPTTRSGATAGTGTAPPPPAAPRPAPEPALTLELAFAPQRIASVVKRGLAGSATCSVDCSIDVAVLLPRGTTRAKARMAAAVRDAALVRSTEPSRFVVKLSSAARRALRRAKSMTVTVVVVAQRGAQTVTERQKVKLKR